MYKTTLGNIDQKLKELKTLMHQKEKIEYQKRDEIDNSDKIQNEKIKKINFKAQQMMQLHFDTITPLNKKDDSFK